MKFDYLLKFTISSLVETGSKCSTHYTKDKIYLQLVFYRDRESRNFESFIFVCSIFNCQSNVVCLLHQGLICCNLNNFLAITNYFEHDFDNFLLVVLMKGVLFLALFWLFDFLETKLCLEDSLYYLKRWLNMAYGGLIHVKKCLLLELI